jgi:hypothetical protein
MTYADLTAAILAWLNKPEVEQSVPTFIALAEAQLNRQLAENGVTGAVVRSNLTLASEYVSAPANLTRPLSLTITAGDRLENVTAQGFDVLKRRRTATGQPTHFTLIGAQVRLLPVPDTPYTAELVYEAVLPALSDANPSNWLLAAYPDAYLYGALVQASPFLGDDTRLATWSSLFTTALDGLLTAERAKRGAQNTAAYQPYISHRRRHSGL